MRAVWIARPASLVLVVILGSLASAERAGAQSVEGSIFGTVTDPSGARLPGVTVTVSSPQLIVGQEVRTTGNAGEYRFPALPPGSYTVTLELMGFQRLKREGILLLAGQSLAVDGELRLAELQESITVSGESPIIDTRSSALVNIQDRETLQNVPLVREFTQVLNIMPGVSDGRYQFAPVNNVHGSTVRQNVYSLDGVNIDDPLQSTTAFAPAFDTFQEIQITTAGITAEYGDASGAVVNYVTKSGGNEFHGGANFFYQDENTQSTNLSQELRDRGFSTGSGVVRNYESGVLLGGPIRANRAWFFSNFRAHEVETSVLSFRGQPKDIERQWFTKGTVQLSPKDRVDGSFNYWKLDSFPASYASGFFNSPDERTWFAFYKEVFFLNPNWTRVINEDTLFDLRGHYSVYRLAAGTPNNDGSPAYLDVATSIQSGGAASTCCADNRRNRHGAKADLSHFRELPGGSHNFKAGFAWQTTPVYQVWFLLGARGSNELQRCGDGCLSPFPDTQHLLFNGNPYRVRLYNGPARQNFGMQKWSAYVQDQWVLGDRLTLNLGVRVDAAYGSIEESPQGPGRWQTEVVFPAQRSHRHHRRRPSSRVRSGSLPGPKDDHQGQCGPVLQPARGRLSAAAPPRGARIPGIRLGGRQWESRL